jgi:hypothetical protein
MQIAYIRIVTHKGEVKMRSISSRFFLPLAVAGLCITAFISAAGQDQPKGGDVVHYTEKGADKTAVGVDDFGKDALKEGKGTVTHVDKAARTVTVKAADGTEDTYHVAKDATVDAGHGVVKSSEWTAKEGDHVVVHYTEEGGKKVVHLFKWL